MYSSCLSRILPGFYDKILKYSFGSEKATRKKKQQQQQEQQQQFLKRRRLRSEANCRDLQDFLEFSKCSSLIFVVF